MGNYNFQPAFRIKQIREFSYFHRGHKIAPLAYTDFIKAFNFGEIIITKHSNLLDQILEHTAVCVLVGIQEKDQFERNFDCGMSM